MAAADDWCAIAKAVSSREGFIKYVGFLNSNGGSLSTEIERLQKKRRPRRVGVAVH